MKSAFRDRPIRQKVNLIIVVASCIALILAGLGLVVYDLTTIQPRAFRDLQAQAELIRINTTAALAFQDQRAATENLATLRAKREVASATLYGADGRVFASYMREPGAALSTSPSPPPPGRRFQNNRLLVSQPVEDEGQRLGWLAMEYTLSPLWSRLPQYGIITGVVLLALLTVSLLLWQLLKSSITEPLARLAEASKAVARSKDPNIRAVKEADDEIGHLTDSFNEMLSTLEVRDSALRESTSQLLDAMTVARMSSWDWDVPAGTMSWGGRESQVFGEKGRPSDASLTSFLDVVHPSDRRAVEQGLTRAAGSGERCELDFRVLDADGHTRWLDMRGQLAGHGNHPARVRGLIMDMTDRRQLEEQLLQSQKLESIGRLAGGVAHDFNNLLTGILGYARFVLQSVPENHAARADILEIERAGTRAASLTGQLLAYARRQMIVPQIVRLNQLVIDMDSLLRRLIGEEVDLETRCARDLWHAQIDPGQFEQVIVNLAVNARDAMPKGGRLTIEASNATLDDSYMRQHPEVLPGEYVVMAVADTGVGMDTATQIQIFEPFFTTKEQGKGTGLGLAVCYGIVKQAGGHLWVYSEPGRGTTFKVLLPRASVEPSAPPSAAPPPQQPPSGGHETLLIVEDEPVVRKLTVRALSEHGYHILEAQDGPSALAEAHSHPGEVHLLITDVVMPGMNGKELADGLTAERPDLRVLYISGYAEHAVVRNGVLQEGIAFLSKPFDLNELARTVRRVLDAAEVAR